LERLTKVFFELTGDKVNAEGRGRAVGGSIIFSRALQEKEENLKSESELDLMRDVRSCSYPS
jgi:hypothetical protein